MRIPGQTRVAILGVAVLILLHGGAGRTQAGPITGGGLLPAGGGSDSDPSFVFTFSDSAGNVGSGTLATIDQGGGSFLATSGTLVVTGGAAVGTYALSQGPGGPYAFDNLLFPNANPLIDLAGLLFAGNGLIINIYSTGPGNYNFDYYDGMTNTIGPSGGLFTLAPAASPVPEPSSLAALGLWGAALAGWRVWRKRAAAEARMPLECRRQTGTAR